MHFTLFFIFLFQLVYISNAEDDEFEGKLSNSMDAKQGEFPWMVGIQTKNENGTFDQFTCGGALVSKNLVLTASLCIERVSGIRLILGSLLLGDNQADPNRTVRDSNLTIRHKGAALIRLSESVTFGNDIRPIDLPFVDEPILNNSPVIASGWGNVGDRDTGGLAQTLQFNNYTAMTSARCRKEYRIAAENTEMCAIAKNSSACVGDDGSPVVKYSGSKAIHVGIIVWSNCHIDEPFIALRTSPLVRWIKSQIRAFS